MKHEIKSCVGPATATSACSLIDEVNPDWRDFADGGDELFWRCGCDTDFVHPESLPVCPICGRERDI